MIKACVNCGNEFDARKNAITCSLLCSEERRKSREKAWVAANKERDAERKAAWASANRYKVNVILRRHYEANRMRLLERAKRWREDNPEQAKARRRISEQKRLLFFDIASRLAPDLFNKRADTTQRTAAVRFCKRFGLDLNEAVR